MKVKCRKQSNNITSGMRKRYPGRKHKRNSKEGRKIRRAVALVRMYFGFLLIILGGYFPSEKLENLMSFSSGKFSYIIFSPSVFFSVFLMYETLIRQKTSE